MDIEAEIRDLKRRVSELEGSFGFLTEQVKAAHKDLLEFETKTDSLAKALPGIVSAAVREANAERGKKP